MIFFLVFAIICQYTLGSSTTWNVTVHNPKSNGRAILQSVFGIASSGRIHAIMGPSGSGKTTLLNFLAAEIPTDSLQVTGSLYLPIRIEDYNPIYIQQEDILFAQLTAEETLIVADQLKSNPSHSPKERLEVINRLAALLSLKNSLQTTVGNAKTRGLSGGEKKRLAIGNEIIDTEGKGSFIFADEPTSGLDCFQAERVVRLLKQLADRDATVVCSIHQPRATVFNMFDDITILSEGRVIYSGPRIELVSYFTSVGYPLPDGSTAAEYYIDLVSVDYTSAEEEMRTKDRIHNLADFFASKRLKKFKTQENLQLASIPTQVTGLSKPRGLLGLARRTLSAIGQSLHKFRILYSRAWKQVTRDKSLNIARLMSSLFSALLFGAIYYKLGMGEGTVPDRLGLLQVAAVNTAMTSLIKATTSFITEKLIVQKERRRGSYGVVPYFIAKVAAELPLASFFPCLFGFIMYKLCGLNSAPGKLLQFLSVLVAESMASSSLGMSIGSLASSVEAGIAVAPAVMVIFIVFGGLYVVNAPSYLSWIPQISLIRWAYEGLCVNEFSGLAFEPKARVAGKSVKTTGESVLANMGLTHSVSHAIKALLGITAANYVFTCLMLWLQNPQRRSAASDLITKREKSSLETKPDSTLESTIADDIVDEEVVASDGNLKSNGSRDNERIKRQRSVGPAPLSPRF